MAASLLLERAADLRSSSLFWQLVNAVVLCVCFYPASAKGKASGEKERQEFKDELKRREETAKMVGIFSKIEANLNYLTLNQLQDAHRSIYKR